MSSNISILLSLVLTTPLLAAPISVTNHAGRVVTGEFGGVSNNTFVISGRAYPLSVLPKSEILRVKKLAGCDVRTAKEKRLDRARAAPRAHPPARAGRRDRRRDGRAPPRRTPAAVPPDSPTCPTDQLTRA